MKANLGWPQAPRWATVSYLTLFTSSWAGASDQSMFVKDDSKSKWAGSDRHLAYQRHYCTFTFTSFSCLFPFTTTLTLSLSLFYRSTFSPRLSLWWPLLHIHIFTLFLQFVLLISMVEVEGNISIFRCHMSTSMSQRLGTLMCHVWASK